MKKFKVSLDGKTIQEIETDTPINFLADKYNIKFVLDSFTSFDLQAGVSKRLLARKNKKRYQMFVGENLTISELKKKYDSFGTVIN